MWASLGGLLGLTMLGATTLACGAEAETSGADTSSTGTPGSTGPASGSSSSSEPPATGSTSRAESTGTSASTASSSDATGPAARLCNGSVALCDRPYDQVVFPTAHNANASREWGYPPINANHGAGLETMLETGIRGFLIDVHDYEGETTTCHGPCGLANQPHTQTLEVLASFIAANPSEVLTIIYQDEAGRDPIVADFEAAGLDAQTYAHPPGEPWPTLGALIDAGTTLVVTAESGSPPPAWYHHVWDVASDTPYTFFTPEEMSCELNRGQADNDLFLMNHWVNTRANLPSEPQATVVNELGFLLERAARCERERGRRPNFLAVDFFEQGDVVEASRMLNESL